MNKFEFSKNDSIDGKMHFIFADNFIVNPGDFVRVYGPNGVGKTTLFEYLCNRVIKEKKHYSTIDLSINNEIYYVPQNYEDYIYLGRTIGHFLVDYLSNNLKLNKNETDHIVKTFVHHYAKIIMDNYRFYNNKGKLLEFDWKTFKKHKITKLSGGQKRLLYIIREFILIQKSLNSNKGKMVFFDEPFNDLDEQNKKFALSLISDIRKYDPDLVIFMITHMPIVEGFNKVIGLKKNGQSIEISDITYSNKDLLQKCDCLFKTHFEC